MNVSDFSTIDPPYGTENVVVNVPALNLLTIVSPKNVRRQMTRSD